MRSAELRKQSRPSTLKPRLESHLIAYAAAGTAGAALLASTPATAEVVYTPAHIAVGSSLNLDLNHDGITDFTIQLNDFDAGHGVLLSLLLDIPGNAVRPSRGAAAPLPIGAKIGPAQKFTSSADTYGGVNMGEHFAYGSTSGSHGPWLNVTNKFLGLRFVINGEFHYGWARLNVSSIYDAVLTGYAYEAVPNKEIQAGQTSGSNDENASISSEFAPSLTLGRLASGTKP
jgi:hypothetical protein